MLTYPDVGSGARFAVQYAYEYGYPTRIDEFTGGAVGTTLWRPLSFDPRGRPTDESFGTALSVRSGFDPLTGLIASRQAGAGGSITNRQSLSFLWDKSGNLRQRRDETRNLTEFFEHDALNRLDWSTRNGEENFDVSIDAVGNVMSRRDGAVGAPTSAYTYDPTRRHAVRTITRSGTSGTVTTSYDYDPNGNVTARSNAAGALAIDWTSFNLPRAIVFTPASTGTGGSTAASGSGGSGSSSTSSGGTPTNVALNKPATSEGTPCAANEGPEKAVNGSVSGGWSDKWCSLNANRWLRVDLQASYDLSSFVVKHAGTGGEATSWNTRDFSIEVSTDGSTWTTPVKVGGNTASTTTHFVTVTARYVRLSIVTAASDGNPAVRIYEIEAWGVPTPTGGGGSGGSNLALNRPTLTEGASCAANEGPEKAVNGTVNGGWSDKWCSLNANRWLRVDLGSLQTLGRFVIKHAETGGEPASYNTRDFNIQVSADGTTWTTAVTVNGNTLGTTTHNVTTTGRYVRLNVITPTQGGDTATRIYELEVYGGTSTPPPPPPPPAAAILSSRFLYAPDRQYFRQTAEYGNGTSVTEYVGRLFEKVTEPGGTFFRHYVPAGSGLVLVTRSGATREYRYVTADHIGSTSLITDAAGNALMTQSFGAYGSRRTEDWLVGVPDWDAVARSTRWGFTAHTMLDNLGLIHMKGRLYDPELGRFLSADPVISEPWNPQDLNRYSYGHNSPLSVVDPTGMVECDTARPSPGDWNPEPKMDGTPVYTDDGRIPGPNKATRRIGCFDKQGVSNLLSRDVNAMPGPFDYGKLPIADPCSSLYVASACKPARFVDVPVLADRPGAVALQAKPSTTRVDAPRSSRWTVNTDELQLWAVFNELLDGEWGRYWGIFGNVMTVYEHGSYLYQGDQNVLAETNSVIQVTTSTGGVVTATVGAASFGSTLALIGGSSAAYHVILSRGLDLWARHVESRLNQIPGYANR